MVGVAVVVLAGTFYLNMTERMHRLEERLEATEQALKPLEPIRRMMESVRTPLAVERPYQAVQATGAANAENEGRDSPRAWCPAREDDGLEWILLTYENPVEAVSVRVVANYNPGAVVRLVAVTAEGAEAELWTGEPSTGRGEFVTTYPISSPAPVLRLKVVIDTAAVPGWNEIDAVALVDPAGMEHWAVEAEASSSWQTVK